MTPLRATFTDGTPAILILRKSTLREGTRRTRPTNMELLRRMPLATLVRCSSIKKAPDPDMH